jgi:membrane fusion protein, multidrug efflux system
MLLNRPLQGSPVETRVDPVPEKENVSNAHRPRQHGSGASGAKTGQILSGGVRRLILPLVAIASVAALVLYASEQWTVWLGSADVQRTDNATVRAEMTRLSARVTGNVRTVHVEDFQRVKAGDLLVEIDPADYAAQVAQAEANVAASQATLDNLENQKALQRATISHAEAQSLSAEAREVLARQEKERQQSLISTGIAGTRQKLEQAVADHEAALANQKASNALVEVQRRQLALLAGQESQLRASRQAAEAVLAAAQLRLGYTRIVAPFDGVVGERQVQPGDYVNVGSSLITVLPLPDVHVTANYKETQLTRVRAGQPVEVTVDSFPGDVLRGHVARVSPASGSTFALLPPDNATGNFTKVVQRIPVRIEFEPEQPLIERLRPGMSVVTSIHVDQDGRATSRNGTRTLSLQDGDDAR